MVHTLEVRLLPGNLRHGSEFLVLTHHLVQKFGTDYVHRRISIQSVHQAGDLLNLHQHMMLQVRVA